jgi:UDP-N-acetylglucosamine--N-acetylmuramyl-(pentapeptide) pyrophosphoryl-undecaprenol N-acetylglucosamine transferase
VSSKRILLTGGGTGGHISPLLAVAHELKQIDPKCHVIYAGERNGKFAHMLNNNTDIDQVVTIFAGKFRRYHGESWLRRLADIKTNVLNLRDALYVVLGTLQSLFLVRRLKPDMVLLKGGFVGVPVGLASAFWHIPFITHDSDALPGLANRLVAQWARYHATGMPAEFYHYPPDSIRYVGVLTTADYKPVGAAEQGTYKKELSLPEKSRVLMVTGGSSGARRLNEGMRQVAPELLEDYKDLFIVHQVGQGQAHAYGKFSHERLQVLEFLQRLYRYSGAADVIVTRAGANAMAEFGVQGKACVVVPNPLLTGGHQLKNAENLVQHQAVLAVDETEFQKDTTALDRAIRKLLDDPALRRKLGKKLQAISIPDAAHNLALLLLEA